MLDSSLSPFDLSEGDNHLSGGRTALAVAKVELDGHDVFPRERGRRTKGKSLRNDKSSLNALA